MLINKTTLKEIWLAFANDIEGPAIAELQTYFQTFFKDKLPTNISIAWLQCRMGLFTHGNNWLALSRDEEGADHFTRLQIAYRALFGSEASVNFNLSRAALYYRQKVTRQLLENPECPQYSQCPRALLINLLPDGQPFSVEKVGTTVTVNLGREFADLLLPDELYTVVAHYLTDRVNTSIGSSNRQQSEPPDYRLLERLLACRQQTFYNSVLSEWTKRAPSTSETLKFPRAHILLAIYMLTLEYVANLDIEKHWMNICDEFLARTPDDLLLSSLCVLQGALYWLRRIGNSDGHPCLLNILLPPRVTAPDVVSKVITKTKVIDMYNGLHIPPDLIAFGGIDIATDIIDNGLVTLQHHILQSNVTLLQGAIANVIQHSDHTKPMFSYSDCQNRWGYSGDKQLLKDRFELPIAGIEPITTLFPADSEQLDVFLRFCRTLSTIGTYEGRSLRFSVILGSELHLNFYFGDDSGSQSLFSDKDDEDDGFDLARDSSSSDMPQFGIRDADKALAKIRGNAGLFQLSDYHLFCHVGKRHEGKVLELSHVVREHPFVQKAPVGNLFSIEVQSNGAIRLLQNRMEICRITQGEWSFKSEEQVKRLREALEEKLNAIHSSKSGSQIGQFPPAWEKPIDILLRVIQRLRDQSHGGIIIVCGSDDFQEWGGKVLQETAPAIHAPSGDTIISRSTPSIRNWDGLAVEQGHLEILTELVGQDGATFVVLSDNGSKLRAYGKYVLHPVYRKKGKNAIKVFDPKQFIIHRPEKEMRICDFWKEQRWPDWEGMYHKWGTRHLSSVAFSALTDNKALVITISEDGDVSCFNDACYQRDLSWR
jgi:hypothetical protein